MAHDQVQLPAGPAAPQTFAAADGGLAQPEADNRFEDCITANDGAIRRTAAEAGIRSGELERQIRLHLPSVDPGLLTPETSADAVESILQPALERAVAIDLHERITALGANMKLLNQADYQGRRDLRLDAVDGPSLPLRVDRIKPSVGNEYQSSLHYLRSIRGDTHLHYGVFLPDAELPMAYIAVSPCDRSYMLEGLIGGYRFEDVVVLTRMYGLPGLPANVMSMMVKHLIRSVRRVTGARIMLTAYNPLLGFNGSVYRASGFRPFATAPVAYSYDHRGQYATRRLGRNARLSRVDTPPNVLMARGLDRISQGSLNEVKSLVRISDDDYWGKTGATVGDVLSPAPLGLASSLHDLEQMLENVWSPQTAQACAAAECSPSMSCNGQCASSSIWLVRELKRQFQAHAVYCSGHVACADRVFSRPPSHSWVEVGGGEGGSLVVDMALRTRQGKYICEDRRSLARRGIRYDAIERLTIDQLPAQPVWQRFESLDDEVYSLGRTAESQ